MGDIVKLALRLFIFAFVASVLLAMTNEVTKDPIEKQKLASKMAALKTVLPGCEYEQIKYEGLADDSVLDEIIFLDTIPAKPGVRCDKIRYISVAHMFAEAISHIYMETSVSPLFL